MSLVKIVERIVSAESKAGRDVGDTALIVVSKMQPLERVESVLLEGHRIFGENRVQEASDKWPALQERFSGVKLHLLGPLQSNKVRQAILLFDVIHSLDRLKLAKAFARVMDETGKRPDLFIQVNTGKESQKAGVMPDDTDAFVAQCRALNLPIIGLMCIPPVDEDPHLHFATLRELAERNNLKGLSMGMSGDFEAAVAEGATHVRVGSAIFGARD